MRLHKPVGILLLLWPTWWALWIAAHGMPSIKNLFIFTAGVVVMRSAGCVINDFADRHVDPHVARTRSRPLAAKKITEKKALILFMGLCVIAFVLVLLTNQLTLILSVFALLTAILYPFTKRYTHWPQLILGIAFSFSIPMAFAAEINHVPWTAFLMMVINILWTIMYDTEYAMTDREDDRLIGIKSTALLFGPYDRLVIGLMQSFVIILLCSMGYAQGLSFIYFVSIGIVILLFLYQQKLITKREPPSCFKAFLNNQWVGCVIFLGIALC